METNKVILKPQITEKATGLTSLGKYTFKVAKWANKIEIKKAVEEIFKVKVAHVKIINVKGKERRRGRQVGRTSSAKKAIVTLVPGQKIELLEGV